MTGSERMEARRRSACVAAGPQAYVEPIQNAPSRGDPLSLEARQVRPAPTRTLSSLPAFFFSASQRSRERPEWLSMFFEGHQPSGQRGAVRSGNLHHISESVPLNQACTCVNAVWVSSSRMRRFVIYTTHFSESFGRYLPPQPGHRAPDVYQDSAPIHWF